MVIRADRHRRGPDPLLTWKVRLFATGAALGLAGILLDIRGLIWAAIGVLVVGFLLRFVPAHRSELHEEHSATGDGDSSEAEPPEPDEPAPPSAPG